MDAADTLARSERAFNVKAGDKSLYDDIYRYMLPFRHSDRPEDTRRRLDGVFDSTAIMAALRAAGRLQAEVTPPMTKWVKLSPGPIFPDDKKPELEKELDGYNRIIHAALDTGEFHTASLEMYQDLTAGTGVLFVLPPDDDDELINYIAAPYSEIALECDSKGHVCGVYWKQNRKAREWVNAYPKLPWPQEIREDAAKEGPDKDICVVKALRHYPKNKTSERWKYEFILEKEKQAIDVSWSQYCPAVTPRFFKLPGEDGGRGPLMVALPHVRVANKVVELILKAAAIALFGVFTATDEGILNPDKAVISPGAIWTVESNATGTYGGRSVEVLDLPRNFTLSDIVLQDSRMQIKGLLMDDQLPPETGAVRTPTEIIARQRSQSFDLSTAFGRLNAELVVPLVQRVCELLRDQRILPKDIDPDQRMLSVEAIGPLSISQKLAEVENLVRALELSLSIGGMELTALIYEVEAVIVRIGQLLGVAAPLFRSNIDKENLKEMLIQMVAQSQMKADQAGAPGPVDAAMGAA